MTELERHPVPDGVDPTDWSLEVTGAVDRPLRLSRRELAALPLETATDDFACVEGWTAEGLEWRGVPLVAVLERAAPTDDARYGLVRAMDGDYACSFPLERLADALLALELDGDPLPVAHGGPARLVPAAADGDCWEHVKWVSSIRLGREPFSAADTAERIARSRIE